MKTQTALPPRSRYDRFGNEVMAGGSVTEQPRRAGGRRRPAPSSASCILGLLAWLAVTNVWMFVFAVGHPRVGLPPRDRPLRHRPAGPA